ncbi:unnamed protein product [Enterobius vermicularis]|uniref:Innexin n=1 Tax=Enterobius vermicularis TaxID=51028 RepID=A0A0N4V9Q0_ENTVE|nr:unnamed protein product [Enterobius vermicularis]
MLEIPLLGRFLDSTSSNGLDDLVDRAHSEFTVWILVLFAMFVGGKQHFGQPIQCMLPGHMDPSKNVSRKDSLPGWSSYGQDYCFVTNTYRLPTNSTVPNAAVRSQLKKEEGVTLTYYQLLNFFKWVPYFLVIQAFCFYLPNWIWRLLQSYSYVDMQAVVSEATAIRGEMKVEKRRERVSKLVDFLFASLTLHVGLREKERWPAYWTVIYLFSKVLGIINDIGQLYLIAYFLGIKNVDWALHPFLLSQRVSREGYNFTASHFPRVTFCDFYKSEQGRVQSYTFQCVVMLNVINEKIFLFLFYWIVVLIVISIGNVIFVVVKVFFHRKTSLKFYIQSAGDNEHDFYLNTDKVQLIEFVNNVFQYDGILLLHFLNSHAGAIVTRDIVNGLWRLFTSNFMAAKSFGPNNVQPPSSASALKTKDQKDIPYINSKTSTFS